MRFAILIVTYTSAQQTKRVIDKLNNGDFDFYIQLDKKIDINTHKELFDIPNVYFVKNRIKGRWAGYSIAQASFNAVREILASGKKYESINLLSGQDYPLKSAAYISEFLKKQAGKQLIKYWDFETEWTEALARINKYHFTDKMFRGRYVLQNIINKIVKKREAPSDLRFYGTNSTFWTLTPECALYVANYVEHNPKLKRFLKYTWGTDEFIYQTVIMNSSYKNTVINNNYRYVDWSAGGSRPKLLVSEDYEKMIATDNIFGRKFDINVDEKILDLIDKKNSTNKETVLIENGLYN